MLRAGDCGVGATLPEQADPHDRAGRKRGYHDTHRGLWDAPARTWRGWRKMIKNAGVKAE